MAKWSNRSFTEAAELPEDEQRGFLEARCGGDAALVTRC